LNYLSYFVYSDAIEHIVVELDKDITYSPVFKGQVQKYIYKEVDPIVDSFTFVIPNYDDVETETEDIDFQIDGIDEDFMSYDPETREIQFFDLTEKQYGTHKITVTLTDQDGEVTSETFTFYINTGVPKEYEYTPPEFDYEGVEDTEKEILRVKIKSFSTLGQMVVEFDKEMDTEFS
jgi:hypothetical protein